MRTCCPVLEFIQLKLLASEHYSNVVIPTSSEENGKKTLSEIRPAVFSVCSRQSATVGHHTNHDMELR